MYTEYQSILNILDIEYVVCVQYMLYTRGEQVYVIINVFSLITVLLLFCSSNNNHHN